MTDVGQGREPGPGRRRLGLALGGLVALWLGWRGVVWGAAGVGLVALFADQAEALTPRFSAAVAAVARHVARAVSTVLFGAIAIALLPVSMLLRLMRWNPLAVLHTPGAWTMRRQATGARMSTRSFHLERGPSGLRRRVRGAITVMAMVVSLTVLGVGVLELTTDAQVDLRRAGARADQILAGPERSWVASSGVRVSAANFPDEPWAEELFHTQAIEKSWTEHPRYGWSLVEVQTPLFNIRDGLRVTLEVDDPEAVVWMFGGSTTFGTAQRDEHTIASSIAAAAEQDGRRVAVVNHGVPAYVNWQETLVFGDLLAAGERPDIAVFFDGCNEMALAFEREFYGRLDATVPQVLTVSEEERARLTRDADRRGYEPSGDNELRIDMAATQYRRGVRRARAAGRRAGVDVVHIWQPGLVNADIDQPQIRQVMDTLGRPDDYLSKESQVVDEVIRRSGVDPVDLTDALAGVDHPTFYDDCHANEFAARIQGEAIYEAIERFLP